MKLFLSAFLFFVSLLPCFSQVATERIEINEKTVVRDSAGKQLPFKDWYALMQTGKYKLGAKRVGQGVEGVLALKTIAELSRQQSLMAASLYEPPASPFFTTGKKLDNFSVKDVNGQTLKLKELAGKVVVLNFWFINCPPCRDEIPRLNEMVAKYKGNEEVVFIAMATDAAYDLRKFLKTTTFDYHVVGDSYTVRNFGIKAFPTNVIIGKDGKILMHAMGGLAQPSINFMKKTIDEALAITVEPAAKD